MSLLLGPTSGDVTPPCGALKGLSLSEFSEVFARLRQVSLLLGATTGDGTPSCGPLKKSSLSEFSEAGARFGLGDDAIMVGKSLTMTTGDGKN